MSTISLASLVQVSGTLIVDAQGKLTVLPEGTAPRPGDVVIDILQDAEVGDELSIELIQADGQGQEITIEDADAEAIIAAIEQGDDPTENEEQATAAGEDSGSSPIAIGSIARAGAQTIAATSFDTSGLQAQGLTSTQSLTLLEFLANSDPTITSEELVGFAIEAGSNQDGSDFEGVSSLSGQLTAADLEFPSESLVWNLLSQPDNLDDYGTFTFQPDGQWTFVLNNDSSLVQALNVEDVVPLVFSVQVVDPLNGTAEQQIVITVSGTNDKPVISADSELAGVVVEAGNLDDGTPTTGVSEISGQLSATDVDSSQESLSWSLVDEADSTYGEFSITVDGVWTYKLANSSDDFSSAQRAAVDALKEGEVIQLFFKVQVTDDQGVRSKKRSR